jgi:hypothetical protein
VSCSSSAPGPLPEATPATETAEQALLDNGTRQTLVAGITSAENLAFASDGRLFVTGNDGIYELTRSSSLAVVASVLEPGGTIFFGGMAEIDGTLYVNAYTAALNSYLYAARLTPSPKFESIYELQTTGVPNGAAADASGRLYVSDTIGGTILRVTLDPKDPLKVIGQDIWLSRAQGILAPNGLKIRGSGLYFTDGLTIKRVPILADGRAGIPVTLVSELTYFDDLYVDAVGILAANYLFGSLQGFSPYGRDVLDTASGVFNGPSAVLPAKGRLGFASGDLLVTEKGGNCVAVYHPSF